MTGSAPLLPESESIVNREAKVHPAPYRKRNNRKKRFNSYSPRRTYGWTRQLICLCLARIGESGRTSPSRPTVNYGASSCYFWSLRLMDGLSELEKDCGVINVLLCIDVFFCFLASCLMAHVTTLTMLTGITGCPLAANALVFFLGARWLDFYMPGSARTAPRNMRSRCFSIFNGSEVPCRADFVSRLCEGSSCPNDIIFSQLNRSISPAVVRMRRL